MIIKKSQKKKLTQKKQNKRPKQGRGAMTRDKTKELSKKKQEKSSKKSEDSRSFSFKFKVLNPLPKNDSTLTKETVSPHCMRWD